VPRCERCARATGGAIIRLFEVEARRGASLGLA
jgi:hypothetical protein